MESLCVFLLTFLREERTSTISSKIYIHLIFAIFFFDIRLCKQFIVFQMGSPQQMGVEEAAQIKFLD